MASKLLSIPAELLASIADELDFASYGNLRLCCKEAEESTFTYFAKKFFGRRKFFRSHLSLTTLLTISESRFGPYLETFILSTALLESDPPNRIAISKHFFLDAYAEQTNIVASGWDRDMLVAAFENLPNLSAIGTEAYDDAEHWDEETVQTSSESYGGYGLRTMLRNLQVEVGWTPRQVDSGLNWVVTTQLLLTAAAKANVRPKTLCFIGKDYDQEDRYSTSSIIGVDDDAFHIPPFMRPLILPVIEGLEELDLQMHNRYIYSLLGTYSPMSCRTTYLREFLGLPVKLQRLKINRLFGGQMPFPSDEQGDDFWAWIGKDHKGKGKAVAVAEEQGEEGSESADSRAWVSPPPVAFPHLQELEICNQDILAEDLTRLLNKVSPTLRKISLHSLILRDRDTEQSDEADENVKIEVELWAGLCGKMAAIPWDGLYEVSLSGFGGLGNWHLSEFDCTAEPDTVHFKGLRMSGPDACSATAEFSYKGPDISNALRQLADDLRAALRDGRHVFNTAFVVGPGVRRRSF